MLETDELRTWAEVDYDAICHNVKEIEKLMGGTRIMGIVKANAYGHGDVMCARALQKAGVHFFAVACLQEGIHLRQQGIEDPILILGYTSPASFSKLESFRLIQTVVSADYGRKLGQYGRKKGTAMPVHIKLDTGMNRTGIVYQQQEKHPEQLLEMYECPGLDVQGIFSHFPVSDELGQDSRRFTQKQMDLFDEAVDLVRKAGLHPGIRHIQNSYGILNYGDRGYDYCRPGLLYMGVTSDDSVPIVSSPDFIPILSLKTKVSMIKTIQPGATVSYGRHFIAQKPTRVASLTVGYADGLPRMCSNKGMEVLIHGQKAPVIGNICMDQCMVDVTNIPDVKEGDIVTVIGMENGQSVTVDQISRLAGTINNETLTRLTSRVPRLTGK